MNRRQFATRSLAPAAGEAFSPWRGDAANLFSADQTPGAAPASQIKEARFPKGFLLGSRNGLLSERGRVERGRESGVDADFRNQKRTINDSGYWYGRVAAANRLDV